MITYSLYALTVILLCVGLMAWLSPATRAFLNDPLQVKKVIGTIDVQANALQDELKRSHDKLDVLHTAVQRYEELYSDWKFYKLVTEALDDATPDMHWAKDIYGRYIIANKQIRDNLLFEEKPYGKTDKELALARKLAVGDRNHTFGEVCGDSDMVVLSKEKPERFIEWGTVSGDLLVLEVHKNVIKDDSGQVVGTCGVARDITAEYRELKDIAETTSCNDTKTRIEMLINKYKFENKDV